jgi:hypothetical protein
MNNEIKRAPGDNGIAQELYLITSTSNGDSNSQI